jgi:RHS repeat-associated protein
MKTSAIKKSFFILLAACILTACKIDLSVLNSNHTSTGDRVISSSGNFNCTEAGGAGCSHTYKSISGCDVESPEYAACIIANTCDPEDTTCTQVESGGFNEILAALPEDGNGFAGWSGEAYCLFGSGFCEFTVDQDAASWDVTKSITASFDGDVVPQVASYTYDYKGQRESKTVGGTTTFFSYDNDGHLIGEYSSTGTPVREYIWLEGHLLAQYDFTTISVTYGAGETEEIVDYGPTNPKVNYYVNDHLGTPVFMADRHGANVTYELEQGPFGERYGEYELDSTVQPLRFPGQYADAETGFNQNWNRDYDPALGRYLQSDPIGITEDYTHNPEFQVMRMLGLADLFSNNQGSNLNHLYGYANQNPLIFTDPLGLLPGSPKKDECLKENEDCSQHAKTGQGKCTAERGITSAQRCAQEWSAWATECFVNPSPPCNEEPNPKTASCPTNSGSAFSQ